MIHRLWSTLLLCLSLLLAAPAHAQSETRKSSQLFNEYQVKALFLYNFANFVDWPEEAFESPTSPIKMCLFGEVPFGTLLNTVNGTLIGDRVLLIAKARDIEDIADGCHILFVGDDKRVQLPEFWDQIRYIYVLSVGEENEFTERGGIINIMRTTDQVQFEINISNAINAGLFISSDLLELAREIKRNTELKD